MQDEWNHFWINRPRHEKESWSKRRIVNILNNYVKKDMVILDAGCGSGYFSNYFISKGCKVYSLDFSEKALEITKKMTQNKSKKYLKKDLLNDNLFLEFGDMFDLIFTDGLFEHFSRDEQDKILKMFITIKKKDGLIITFVPNRYSFWTIIKPFFMHGIKESAFTLEDIILFMERCGQKVIKKEGINVLPFKYSPEFLANKIGMLIYTVTTN